MMIVPGSGFLVGPTSASDAYWDNVVLLMHMDGVDNGTSFIDEKGHAIVRDGISSTYTFGSLSGTVKWYGGVLAPNGKIYGIPNNSTTVLEIDPVAKTTTTFGNVDTGTYKWAGGVLAPNGKIYGIPYESTTVLEIDPATNTTTTFGSLSGIRKWWGGVLAPNGKIYGIPFNSTTILEIDPATNTTTTFGSLTGSAKWAGGVLAPNGKIYGIPHHSTTVLEIDPATNTTTTFGSLSGTAKWIGGVLAPNGKIYGIPSYSATVLEIDPVAKTTTTFGDLGGTGKWAEGVLAPNGKIYGIPYTHAAVLEIDPATNTTTTFGSLAGLNKWAGGVLAPNGKIYGIPYDSTTALEIEPTILPITKTGIKKYGTASAYFDGTGDYLAPNITTTEATWWIGDYTMECWIYRVSGAGQIWWNTNSTGTGAYFYIGFDESGYMRLYTWASQNVIRTTTTNPLPLNQWSHVAFVNQGGTFTFYVDGNACSPSMSASTPPGIYTLNRLGVIDGYIDDFRITKGVARYTSNFTPPSEPFPNS